MRFTCAVRQLEARARGLASLARSGGEVFGACEVTAVSIAPERALHLPDETDVLRLTDFVHSGCAVLTGAGISTESGIPCYRGKHGSYRFGHKPMMHYEFVRSALKRKRYWARSIKGWRYFHHRSPNITHKALAALECECKVSGIVTQNVDRLHHAAGSRNVVELHGRNDMVRCLKCSAVEQRIAYQVRVETLNARWIAEHLPPVDLLDVRADGDAELGLLDFKNFKTPHCSVCDFDIVMPCVVFFGGSIPPETKAKAANLIESAERLLILGSSCTVFSAFDLVRRAARRNQPIALVNIGETRVDDLVTFTIPARCGAALSAVCRKLGVSIADKQCVRTASTEQDLFSE